MHAKKFDYYKATSIEHTLELLAENDDAKLLAGGHGLIPAMKKREQTPDTIVDIAGLDELNGIEETENGIRIGALSTHSTVVDSEILADSVPVIPRTAANITGGKQVHNFATIGGNIARAHPGYDYEGALVAAGCTITIHGPTGKQTVSTADFFRGALSTCLTDTQLVTSIEVPTVQGIRCGGYAKKKEPASGNAIVGVATEIVFENKQSNSISSARIAVNGLQETAVRLRSAENALVGDTVTEKAVTEAAAVAGDSLDASEILDNKKASAEYRLCLLEPQVRKSVTQATLP